MYDGQRVKCVRGLCADYARNMPKLKNQRSIFLRLHRLHRCFNELHRGFTDVSMSFTDASQTLHRRFTGFTAVKQPSSSAVQQFSNPGSPDIPEARAQGRRARCATSMANAARNVSRNVCATSTV